MKTSLFFYKKLSFSFKNGKKVLQFGTKKRATNRGTPQIDCKNTKTGP